MESTTTRPARAAYSIPEAAEMLGVSVSTIYNRIDDGTLRRVKLGKRALIPAAEIDRFLAGDDTTYDERGVDVA